MPLPYAIMPLLFSYAADIFITRYYYVTLIMRVQPAYAAATFFDWCCQLYIWRHTPCLCFTPYAIMPLLIWCCCRHYATPYCYAAFAIFFFFITPLLRFDADRCFSLFSLMPLILPDYDAIIFAAIRLLAAAAYAAAITLRGFAATFAYFRRLPWLHSAPRHAAAMITLRCCLLMAADSCRFIATLLHALLPLPLPVAAAATCHTSLLLATLTPQTP